MRIALLGAVVWVSAAAALGAQTPPNLVVVLVDDLGYADVGPYDHDGDPLTPMVTNTPVLDQMAFEGVTLTQFYSGASVCSPTRAGLLTGRHPARVGITGPFEEFDPDGMDPWEITIAEALKPAGYRTGMVGKWHLGEPVQYLPTRQGFDAFYGPPYSNDMVPFYILRDETVENANPDQAMLTSDYTNEAKLLITQAVAGGKPFFLFLSHSMPHVPVYTSPAFTGITGRGLYADAVFELDWSLGEIRTHLAALGVAQDTLIVFTSDNGPWNNTHGPEPWHPEPWRWVGGSAAPFQGSKANSYEGGVRVPFVAQWPGVIPPGTTVDEPASMMDLFTTFVQLGGGQVPTDRVIDGVNIYPLLTGTGSRPATPFFAYDVQAGQFQGNTILETVRLGDFKQHFAPGFVPTALYDLAADPGETTPLALPQTTALLKAVALEFDCDLDEGPFVAPKSNNVALGRPAAASSASACATASHVVDGALGSRWASETGEDQWVEVDLGAHVQITWVGLAWGDQYARHYRIQVSPDGQGWVTVHGTQSGNGGRDFALVEKPGRFVRVRCFESSAGLGYELRELQVFSFDRSEPLATIP